METTFSSAPLPPRAAQTRVRNGTSQDGRRAVLCCLKSYNHDSTPMRKALNREKGHLIDAASKTCPSHAVLS